MIHPNYSHMSSAEMIKLASEIMDEADRLIAMEPKVSDLIDAGFSMDGSEFRIEVDGNVWISQMKDDGKIHHYLQVK